MQGVDVYRCNPACVFNCHQLSADRLCDWPVYLSCAASCGASAGDCMTQGELIRPADSMMHDLKCWPEYFKDIESGIKTFELRNNDRGFKQGDLLFLREFCPAAQEYSGRQAIRFVTHLMDLQTSPFAPGWQLPQVIMSIVPFEHKPSVDVNAGR